MGQGFFDVFFRSLEFLYDSLEKNNTSLPSYWENVVSDAKSLLLSINCKILDITLGSAIANSFLSIDIKPKDCISEDHSLGRIGNFSMLSILLSDYHGILTSAILPFIE